jgi:hypothetical protein
LYARDPDYDGPLYKAPQVVFSCDCIVPQTRLLTQFGYISVEDILDRKWAITSHPVPYFINGKIKYGSIPFYKGIREIMMVTVDDGRTLELTPDHKVLASNDVANEFWTAASNLKVGDKVVCDGSEVSRHQGYILRRVTQIFKDTGIMSPVYDVEMQDRKEPYFVAEGVIIHNCERFLYRWEYALWRAGAAEIRFGNGEPPNITNPRFIPAACKHYARVFKVIRELKK